MIKATPIEIRKAADKTNGTCTYHSTCFDEYNVEESKKPKSKRTPVEKKNGK